MAACSSISVSRWNSRDARSRCSRRARAAARALSDSAVACAATVSNPPTTTPMKAQTAVLTALPLAYGQYRLGREHDSPRGPHEARALATPHPQPALRGCPGATVTVHGRDSSASSPPTVGSAACPARTASCGRRRPPGRSRSSGSSAPRRDRAARRYRPAMTPPEKGTPTRSRLARTARLAALPAAYAGRTAVGIGKRIGGRPAEAVAAQLQQRTAEQLFATLGQLKGGAMKVGQALSAMESALPEQLAGPYRDALTKLQEAAPAMPTARVHEQLTSSLGSGWRQRFR